MSCRVSPGVCSCSPASAQETHKNWEPGDHPNSKHAPPPLPPPPLPPRTSIAGAGKVAHPLLPPVQGQSCPAALLTAHPPGLRPAVASLFAPLVPLSCLLLLPLLPGGFPTRERTGPSPAGRGVWSPAGPGCAGGWGTHAPRGMVHSTGWGQPWYWEGDKPFWGQPSSRGRRQEQWSEGVSEVVNVHPTPARRSSAASTRGEVWPDPIPAGDTSGTAPTLQHCSGKGWAASRGTS